MATSEIFDLSNSNIIEDNIITEYEYYEYIPTTSSNYLNTQGSMRIEIRQRDQISHPSEAYLLISGKILKTDGTPVVGGDMYLIHNAPMFFFNEMSMYINNQEIETVRNLGEATSMLGFLKYTTGESRYSQGWSPTDEAGNMPKFGNTFEFLIPLTHIFGFLEDYDKVLYDVDQFYTLNRSPDFQPIDFVGTGGFVAELEKVAIRIPMIKLSPAAEIRFMKNYPRTPIKYRRHSTQMRDFHGNRTIDWLLSPDIGEVGYLILAFQSIDRTDKKSKGFFEHLGLKEVHVDINNRRYPKYIVESNFIRAQSGRLYQDCVSFNKLFHNKSGEIVSYFDYVAFSPIVVIDLTKRENKSTQDIRIKANFDIDLPTDGARVFAVLISDTELTYTSE